MSHGHRFGAIAQAFQHTRPLRAARKRLSSRTALALLACLFIGPAAFADLSTLRCNSTITPAGPDPQGGYLATVNATCNETFTYGIMLHAGSYRNDGVFSGIGGGEFICRNASSCSGIAHYACLPPGDWTLTTGVTDEFNDVIIPGNNGTAPFAVSNQTAGLSVAFEPDLFGGVQATISYSIPQNAYPHALFVTVTSGPPFFGTSNYSSPNLPLSGSWVLPVSLRPGSFLDVQAGLCGDPVVLGQSGGGHLAMTVPDVANQKQYFLQLGMSTDPASPYTLEKRATSGATVNANVSLGSVFAVKLIKKTPGGGGISTVVPLNSSYVLMNKNVAPAFETNYNLFDDSVAVSVGGGLASGIESRFVAVHLGTMMLQVLPLTESNVQPITVKLNVVRPPALGGEHNEWDARLIDEAHERGIPPQILKGQIRQESPTFRDTEWRYEPCSSDFAEISAGQTLINTTPYSLYAMDGALDDADFAPTVDLRNRLNIDINGTKVTHADRGVTARQLWDANPHQNWATIKCGAKTAFLRTHTMTEFLDALQFVAQTPTASSYGVLQALYSTAIGYNWSVTDASLPGGVSQSPRYLRDTAESLALHHGGSIFVGGTEDVQRYWDHGSSSNTFPTQEDFFDSFKEPLRYYTGGGIADYGTNIIDTYQYDYLPPDPTPVFP